MITPKKNKEYCAQDLGNDILESTSFSKGVVPYGRTARSSALSFRKYRQTAFRFDVLWVSYRS